VKVRQDGELMWPARRGRGVRRDVEVGSKPAPAGAARALRFWTMESSMALLETRRNSVRRQ